MTPREFWSLVAVGDDMRSCWRWMGPTRGEYGFVTVNSVQVAAHRYAWSFAYGVIPTGGLVLHSCDVPLCVNPRHLRIGTHEDNNNDRSVLTRVRQALAKPLPLPAAPPKEIGRARPIRSRIRDLRTMRGLTQRDLAALVGTTQACVAQWEGGVSSPNSRRIAAVAAALGVSVAELFMEAA